MSSLKEKFLVTTYDTDLNGGLKPYSLMNYFQEIASRNAANLHFGYDDLRENSIFWALSRIRVKINKMPRWNDDILLETWPMRIDKILALRGFQLRDPTGNVLIDAISAWLALDLETRRPSRLDRLMKDVGWLPEFGELKDTPGKIILPEMKDHSSLKVKYSDIDVNRHVSNSKYVEWAIDAVADKNSIDSIKEYQINFTKEAKLGDAINIQVSKLNNGELFVCGVNRESEQKHFEMKIIC